MKTLKKLSIAAAALVLSVSTASAIAVPVGTSYSGSITDNYVGKGYQLHGAINDGDIIGVAHTYDVMTMTYAKTGDNLVVRVYTNFATIKSFYQYGDLFLSADTSDKAMSREASKLDANDNWDYAFKMTNNNSEASSGTGDIVAYDAANALYSSERDSYMVADDTDQVVRVSDDASAVKNTSGTWIKGANYIEYSFSLIGTDLINAPALAFRWSMTCGNDIIQGHTDGGPGDGGPDVAEPATLGLLGLGLVGFGLVRRRRVA